MIGDVRACGLMLSIELVKDPRTKEPYSSDHIKSLETDIAMLGLLLSARANQLQLMPPLIIAEPIAAEIVRIIGRALDPNPVVKLANKSLMLKEFASSKTKP